MLSNKIVVVFTRTPEHGKVKTRLQPELTQAQSLLCHKLLLENVLQNIQSNNYKIELWIYPDKHHPVLQQYQQQFTTSLHSQQGRDLGERMYNCFDHHIKQGKQVVLVGSDCPQMNSNYIAQAFDQLRENDIVLGPAHDGGYVLIAAKNISREIFQGVEWGSEKVYQQSITRLNHSNLSHNSLSILDDIDTYEDLLKYPEILKQIPPR